MVILLASFDRLHPRGTNQYFHPLLSSLFPSHRCESRSSSVSCSLSLPLSTSLISPFYNMRPPSLDAANPPASAFQSSRSRSRYDRLLPIQVYSCWNGIAEFRASLFEAPLGLRFRALEGTDSDSECYLICKDIWAALTPAWEWFAADPKPTADNRLNRWRVLKWGSSKISKAAWKLARSSSTSTGGAAVLRGARIMVNPRVAVAYTQEMYQRARQDSNMKIFAGVRGTPQEQREEIEAREAVDWVLFPPTKVVTYKYCRSSSILIARSTL